MKTCSKCKIEKNDLDFSLNKNMNLHSYCYDCLQIYYKKHNEKYKEKKKDYYKKHYEINKEKRKERLRNDYLKRKEYLKWYDINIRYGISKEEYEKLLLNQNKKCAICKSPYFGYKDTNESKIDYCTESKKVRGLLCKRCSTLLNILNDNDNDNNNTLIKNIMSYLKIN